MKSGKVSYLLLSIAEPVSSLTLLILNSKLKFKKVKIGKKAVMKLVVNPYISVLIPE